MSIGHRSNAYAILGGCQKSSGMAEGTLSLFSVCGLENEMIGDKFRQPKSLKKAMQLLQV